MLYAEPALTAEDHEVLNLISEQRRRLAIHTRTAPRRWLGSLRRRAFARAIQGSNSIEGYNATMDEALAAVENDPPEDERSETWMAINGYRQAMTYVMQAATDPYFQFSKQFLKSLHFMMINFDLSKNPGQWRPGRVHVFDQRSGEIVYDAPDVERVDPLVEDLSAYARRSASRDPLVKAAMCHLNLVMIHPFSDGNGRMARCLQTFILARDGPLHPVFSSIEEWLGEHTEEYYAVLAETGGGSWTPERSARPWIRFCLKAHFQQASRLLRRIEEYEQIYTVIDAIVKQERLHQRMALPLFDICLGRPLTNSRYQKEAEVSTHVAARDLKRLSDLKLITPQGEKRGRRYVGGEQLTALRRASRISRPLIDPYRPRAE